MQRLWFFHAVERYIAGDRRHATLRLLMPKLVDIVDHHLRGTRFRHPRRPAPTACSPRGSERLSAHLDGRQSRRLGRHAAPRQSRRNQRALVQRAAVARAVAAGGADDADARPTLGRTQPSKREIVQRPLLVCRRAAISTTSSTANAATTRSCRPNQMLRHFAAIIRCWTGTYWKPVLEIVDGAAADAGRPAFSSRRDKPGLQAEIRRRSARARCGLSSRAPSGPG